MTIRQLFNLFALFEIVTGIALFSAPALAIVLLFGDGAAELALPVTRVLAIALVALGVAAFQPATAAVSKAGRAGLFIYNAGIMVFLPLYGTTSESFGVLLWPTAALHMLIGLIMLRIFCIPTDK